MSEISRLVSLEMRIVTLEKSIDAITDILESLNDRLTAFDRDLDNLGRKQQLKESIQTLLREESLCTTTQGSTPG